MSDQVFFSEGLDPEEVRLRPDPEEILVFMEGYLDVNWILPWIVFPAPALNPEGFLYELNFE